MFDTCVENGKTYFIVPNAIGFSPEESRAFIERVKRGELEREAVRIFRLRFIEDPDAPDEVLDTYRLSYGKSDGELCYIEVNPRSTIPKDLCARLQEFRKSIDGFLVGDNEGVLINGEGYLV